MIVDDDIGFKRGFELSNYGDMSGHLWLVGDWFGITVYYPIAAAESRGTKG